MEERNMRIHANRSVELISLPALAIAILSLTPTLSSAAEQTLPLPSGAAPPVTAVTLNTSSLFSDSGQSYPACNISNITGTPLNAKVVLLSSTPTVLYTTGTTPVAIPAGATIEYTAATGYTGFSRCRFVIYGDPAGVRANISIFHFTGTYYETLALDDAR
jgi:hypothetical protein